MVHNDVTTPRSIWRHLRHGTEILEIRKELFLSTLRTRVSRLSATSPTLVITLLMGSTCYLWTSGHGGDTGSIRIYSRIAQFPAALERRGSTLANFAFS
jgi:hypothetical protein